MAYQTTTAAPKTASKLRQNFNRVYASTSLEYVRTTVDSGEPASALALFNEEEHRPRSCYINPFFTEALAFGLLIACKYVRMAFIEQYGAEFGGMARVRGESVYPLGPTQERSDLEDFNFIGRVHFPRGFSLHDTFIISMICHQDGPMVTVVKVQIFKIEEKSGEKVQLRLHKTFDESQTFDLLDFIPTVKSAKG